MHQFHSGGVAGGDDSSNSLDVAAATSAAYQTPSSAAGTDRRHASYSGPLPSASPGAAGGRVSFSSASMQRQQLQQPGGMARNATMPQLRGVPPPSVSARSARAPGPGGLRHQQQQGGAALRYSMPPLRGGGYAAPPGQQQQQLRGGGGGGGRGVGGGGGAPRGPSGDEPSSPKARLDDIKARGWRGALLHPVGTALLLTVAASLGLFSLLDCVFMRVEVGFEPGNVNEAWTGYGASRAGGGGRGGYGVDYGDDYVDSSTDTGYGNEEGHEAFEKDVEDGNGASDVENAEKAVQPQQEAREGGENATVPVSDYGDKDAGDNTAEGIDTNVVEENKDGAEGNAPVEDPGNQSAEMDSDSAVAAPATERDNGGGGGRIRRRNMRSRRHADAALRARAMEEEAETSSGAESPSSGAKEDPAVAAEASVDGAKEEANVAAEMPAEGAEDGATSSAAANLTTGAEEEAAAVDTETPSESANDEAASAAKTPNEGHGEDTAAASAKMPSETDKTEAATVTEMPNDGTGEAPGAATEMPSNGDEGADDGDSPDAAEGQNQEAELEEGEEDVPFYGEGNTYHSAFSEGESDSAPSAGVTSAFVGIFSLCLPATDECYLSPDPYYSLGFSAPIGRWGVQQHLVNVGGDGTNSGVAVTGDGSWTMTRVAGILANLMGFAALSFVWLIVCSPVRTSQYLLYLTLAAALLEAVKTGFFFNVNLCTSPIFLDVTHARTEGAYLREAQSCSVQTAGIASIFSVLFYSAAAVMIYRFPHLSGGGGHPHPDSLDKKKNAPLSDSNKTALTEGMTGTSDFSLDADMMGMSKISLGGDVESSQRHLHQQPSERSFANERGRASVALANPATRNTSLMKQVQGGPPGRPSPGGMGVPQGMMRAGAGYRASAGPAVMGGGGSSRPSPPGRGMRQSYSGPRTYRSLGLHPAGPAGA